MLQKSQCSITSVQNLPQNSKVEKKLRFNEENIQQTHHPVQKDYGFIAIPEAKTPFPRYADPIAAEDLRKRLQESLDRANCMMRNDNDEGQKFSMDGLQTPLPSFDFEDEERRRKDFYRKRKKFYQSEYIIAQQKSMSSEIPEPGPSVGENWRIVDNARNSSLPSNFNSFISSSNRQSTVNYETLREIAEQMSSSSEQFI